MSKLPPELNALIRRLERQNSELAQKVTQMEQQNEEAFAAAEEADRVAQVQALLNGYTFVNEASRSVAERYLLTNAYRDEEGNLIAGPEDAPVPIKDFAAEAMGNLTGLLQPKQAGGAGAFAGSPAGGAKKPPQLEDIKPGMSREKAAEIMRHALSQLPQTSEVAPEAGV